MRLHHATGILLIFIGSALSGMGQGRPAPGRHTYGIAGTVRDDYDQHTMENIRVDLMAATGTPINTTFTRGSGEFEFSGVPNGDYTIEIVVRDYEPIRESVRIENSVRRGLSIFLRRPITAIIPKSSATIFSARTECSKQGAR